MLTVLMIDDDEVVTATIREEAEKQIAGIRFVVETDFDKADEQITFYRPDILILDIYRGLPVSEDVAGQHVWANVWRTRFCPIVVYTAGYEGLDPAVPEAHPFVRYLEKGEGTDLAVIERIQSFVPTAEALRSAEAEVERVFQNVLQSVAQFAFQHTDDAVLRTEMIVRAARRRVAAMMDEAICDDKRGIYGWEQYLVPPIGNTLMMGDIVQVRGANNDDATSYRVVLSPSCDIQRGRSKVERALLAKCTEGRDYVVHGVGISNAKKVKERLPIALNEAHAGGFVLLPSLPGCFPPLAVNMRALDLVAVDGIGQPREGDHEYRRVVSVDSPFREQLAWAYLQISGRPGMPDRDHSATVEELLGQLEPGAVKK